MVFACVIPHNICIDKGNLVPRKFDLSYDIASNKRRGSNELRDLLDLADSNVKNLQTGRCGSCKSARENNKSILVRKRGVLMFDQGKNPN